MGAKSYFLLNNEILSSDEFFSQKEKEKSEDRMLLADKRILIIDDNPINLSVAEKTLSKFGAESIKVYSAKEGVAAFIAEDVDLILMDLQMPVVNGFEATQLIHQTKKFEKAPIPILAYTTFSHDEVRQSIEEYKLDGYIGKPFTQTQVLDTIMRVLK